MLMADHHTDTHRSEGFVRYTYDGLVRSVASVFERLEMQAAVAVNLAASLVDADAMGHATHGAALVPWYVDNIRGGRVTLAGDPTIVADRPACVAMHGQGLPGSWAISKAIDIALARTVEQGIVTVSISDSFHTGALAVYLPRLTEAGFMAVLSCSGPAARTVAPFGGKEALFTPNPIAAGIPTDGDPILLDVSASITTNNRVRQLAAEGRMLPGDWMLDVDGNPTSDPALLASGATLLPIGGLDHGHKGYALTLLVEALTQGLSGFGRRQKPQGRVIVNSFLQVIDPDAFGGRMTFVDEMSWLRDACRSNPPRPGVTAVRLPGQDAMEKRREATNKGVSVSAGVAEHIEKIAASIGVELGPRA